MINDSQKSSLRPEPSAPYCCLSPMWQADVKQVPLASGGKSSRSDDLLLRGRLPARVAFLGYFFGEAKK